MPGVERAASPLVAWRLVSRHRAASAFDGEGARLYGGRWNPPGIAVVYASTALSLAALEVLVHVDPDTAPRDLVALRAELPAGTAVSRLVPSDLPAGWRAYPAPAALQALGAAWVRAGATVALRVPSAVVPREDNLLLNPAHPAMAKLRIAAPEPFSFDPRLWKGEG